MTDKELHRLKKTELLELLVLQQEENDQLRKEVRLLRKRLEERDIEIRNAGSIAEASLRLNGVFEAAQQAADQYLYNVRKMTDRR